MDSITSVSSWTGIRGRNTFLSVLKKNLTEDQELIDVNRLYLTIFHEALFIGDIYVNDSH